MANNLAVNPIVVDSTGIIFSQATKVKAIGIRASADAWVVVLDNVKLLEGTPRDGGVINFAQACSITNDRGGLFTFPGGQVFHGLWAKTLTNVSEVLVYLE